tara:strand:- start:363 stop:647 length:285 start_codon:yes stop_codon:yes gene_type:complete
METIPIIIISVLGVSVVILVFTTWNLLRKVEKTEDIILNYNSFIQEYSKQLDIADKRLKEIDDKNLFKSDDEIGWFFTNLKRLQNDLSKFKQNQ